MAKTAPQPTRAKPAAAKSLAVRKAAPARKTAPLAKPPRVRQAPKPVKAAVKPVENVPEKTPEKAALKLVRDGFTMPQQDFDLIAALKKRAIVLQRPAKKSELLRAGLHVLHRLPDESLLAALEGLVRLKLGRPKKGS